MKKFMFLSYGFEKPTPEIMAAWGTWFESIADRVVEGGHFPMGREISKQGTQDLPLGAQSITGYCIFTADSLDAAETIVKNCPYIESNRVYEIMTR